MQINFLNEDVLIQFGNSMREIIFIICTNTLFERDLMQQLMLLKLVVNNFYVKQKVMIYYQSKFLYKLNVSNYSLTLLKNTFICFIFEEWHNISIDAGLLGWTLLFKLLSHKWRSYDKILKIICKTFWYSMVSGSAREAVVFPGRAAFVAHLPGRLPG